MNEQISVKLALDIVYVYGVVNGEVADFQLTDYGVWSATVPSNSEGRYEVEITAYNSLGTPSTYTTVVYYLDGLIPPKTDWRSDDKYNSLDLNRVEANTKYIAEVMETAGYHPELAEVSVNWTMESIPFLSDINRIEGNILALERAFTTPPGWEPPVVAWARGRPFTSTEANRLERNILLIYGMLLDAIASFKYAGTFACGEDGEIY